jgi:hypothetical protein
MPTAALPSASAPAGPIDITWTDQPAGGLVMAVTADQGQFVAVGGIGSGLSAWTSSNGTTWQAHAITPPTPAQLGIDPSLGGYLTNPLVAAAMMGRMARFADTLFSFGTFFGPIDFLRPVGWRTTDAQTWEFIVSTNPFFTNGYGVMDLVASDQELLAANHGFPDPSGGTFRWTSSTSWVETTPTGAPYATSGFNVFDLVWTGVQFVAVGDHGSGTDAVSFVSPTGQTWVQSPAASVLTGASMRSVAVAPDGTIVAVGSKGGVPQAFTSTDGLTWSALSLPGGGDVAHGLIPLDGGLLAIGDDGTNTLTWTSPDGVIWTVGQILSGQVTRWEAEQSGGETGAALGDTVTVFVNQGTDPNLTTVLWVGQIQP